MLPFADQGWGFHDTLEVSSIKLVSEKKPSGKIEMPECSYQVKGGLHVQVLFSW